MQICIFVRVIYKMELEQRNILFIQRGKRFCTLNITHIFLYIMFILCVLVSANFP